MNEPFAIPARLLAGGLTLLLLTACVTTPEHAGLHRDEPVFSPAAFFAGRTVGEGTLRVVFSGEAPVHVVGDGRVAEDGTLVLVQRIERGDAALTLRTWRIRTGANGRLRGTLTSAGGPVVGAVDGNRLHLRFSTADGGLDTEQWLYLQPGGQVALNRMVVRKFGLPVAVLAETIRKAD